MTSFGIPDNSCEGGIPCGITCGIRAQFNLGVLYCNGTGIPRD